MIFNQDVFNITCAVHAAIDVHKNGVIYVDVALLHIYAAFFGVVVIVIFNQDVVNIAYVADIAYVTGIATDVYDHESSKL